MLQRILKWPFILHAGLILVIVWITAHFGVNYPLIYVFSFIFLYHVENRHHERTVKRIRHEAMKCAAQKQLLSDVETVRWLNETVEKMWPVFMEKFASEDFLGVLFPFFLNKYKPWTVQDAVLQSFSLGRSPPLFTQMRAVDQCLTDDHLVLEAAMEFVAAEDMHAVMSVQLRKRLGGIWTKLHISNLHIEGKVRIGLKFLGQWPFVSRMRISFDNAPYLQITAKPLSNYGMDMAELPGIATWLDAMIADALEDSVVKPNMLVIDVEKIAQCWSKTTTTCRLAEAASPVLATVLIEVIEAAQLRAADTNGLSDPFVKGAVNAHRFKTQIKWKNLNPKWMEEFRVPIHSWDAHNSRLILHVRDKDIFRDDRLGYCEVMLSKFRDGNRHVLSLPLKAVKTGRLTVAITVEEHAVTEAESEVKIMEDSVDDGDDGDVGRRSFGSADTYEMIETGVNATGIFSILRPGKAVQQKRWRGRKGRKAEEGEGEEESNVLNLLPESSSLFSGPLGERSDSDDDHSQGRHHYRKRFWRWSQKGKQELVSSLRRGESGNEVKVIVDATAAQQQQQEKGEEEEEEEEGEESPGRRSMKERAKGVVKQAEKTASHIGHSIWKRRSMKKDDDDDDDVVVT